jgi:hypothetical protein
MLIYRIRKGVVVCTGEGVHLPANIQRLTGLGIIPPADLTLRSGDQARISNTG